MTARLRLLALSFLVMSASAVPAEVPVDEDPAKFLGFVEEFAGNCVARNGVQLLIRNTHPTRKLRVWMDRYFMGTGTGDRSRTDLLPGAEPEPLGCSRSSNGPQEWRLVRAVFFD